MNVLYNPIYIDLYCVHTCDESKIRSLILICSSWTVKWSLDSKKLKTLPIWHWMYLILRTGPDGVILWSEPYGCILYCGLNDMGVYYTVKWTIKIVDYTYYPLDHTIWILVYNKLWLSHIDIGPTLLPPRSYEFIIYITGILFILYMDVKIDF